ncbi:hypothetical protein COCNU_14G006860 [Cocos nucifera]|uniref:Uncharacterized protein n=1 Tax=Cocos nucifera TaxID=13894 RepID=A0A8K0NCF6_COCNU|nr:hypothetical protein COCNU_14G006860 [Cocos nucifera]
MGCYPVHNLLMVMECFQQRAKELGISDQGRHRTRGQVRAESPGCCQNVSVSGEDGSMGNMTWEKWKDKPNRPFKQENFIHLMTRMSSHQKLLHEIQPHAATKVPASEDVLGGDYHAFWIMKGECWFHPKKLAGSVLIDGTSFDSFEILEETLTTPKETAALFAGGYVHKIQIRTPNWAARSRVLSFSKTMDAAASDIFSLQGTFIFPLLVWVSLIMRSIIREV